MIKSKEDYIYYLEADRVAKSLSISKGIKAYIKNLFFSNKVWEFQKCLRKLEYFKNCKSDPISKLKMVFIKMKFRKLSLQLGFSIPPNVFGPGLSIAHYGTIVVNSGSRIGANCRLHACVNIGTEAGQSNKAPQIGDNTYIGPGAKIYGDIILKNGTIIGANAVVNKSFEQSDIAIAGLPAKIIAEIDASDYVICATNLIDSGVYLKHNLTGLNAREIKELSAKG